MSVGEQDKTNEQRKIQGGTALKCEKCKMEMEVYKGQEIQEGYKVIYRCRNSQCPEYEKNIEVVKDKCL